MEKEKWKRIKDHPDYEVSDKGRVKSHKMKIPRILKPVITRTGYHTVFIDGKQKTIHRLVGLAFISNPYNKKEINHLDEDKSNNRTSNLQWTSRAENMKHHINRNTGGRGNRILTDQEVLEIRKSEDIPARILSRKYCVSAVTISYIKKRIRRGNV